jgi:3-oxoacyl-(acyl-carrier-protein) synthase
MSIGKAVMTAWAWRTPMGNDENVLARLLAGENAFQTKTHFDNSLYDCPLVAVINTEPTANKHQRYLRRMGLFALELAKEVAIKANIQQQQAERVGLFFGYGGLRAHWNDLMPAFVEQVSETTQCWQRGLHLLHPFWMLQHLSNNAHAIAAQELGARGDGATYSGGNAGAQAIAAAIRALNTASIDTAIVVGYDSLLEPETLVELRQHHAINRQDSEHLTAPYSANAQGFVPAEAAAAMVLQRADSTSEAQCFIQALACADGNPHPANINTLAQMTKKLLQAGDSIDGVGLAQADYDLAEKNSLETILANQNYPATTLTCLASSMGQSGAAHCLLQAIALSEFLKRQQLLAIHGLKVAESGLLSPLTVATHTTSRAALALSASAPGLAGVLRVELL